ncbi:MAG: hypothetical protein WA192_00110 [Candidatus Acidiferrales bacterium]
MARAQGGPPLLTNDPGTPGNGNWEINLGVMQVLRQGTNIFQVPQIDLNYGLGDRIQLTYEVPYVLQNSTGQPVQTGWSNGLPGVKWRFFQQDHGGWNISTFPQLEINGPPGSVKLGLAGGGTRFLLPFEVTKAAGPINLDFEAGYFFPFHSAQSHQERILGLAAGHVFTPKFEMIGEGYNDSVRGVPPHDTTFDLGGRYKFHKGLLLLFMAGRSFAGNSSGQPEFVGYVGLQILLRKYGRELNPDD